MWTKLNFIVSHFSTFLDFHNSQWIPDRHVTHTKHFISEQELNKSLEMAHPMHVARFYCPLSEYLKSSTPNALRKKALANCSNVAYACIVHTLPARIALAAISRYSTYMCLTFASAVFKPIPILSAEHGGEISEVLEDVIEALLKLHCQAFLLKSAQTSVTQPINDKPFSQSKTVTNNGIQRQKFCLLLIYILHQRLLTYGRYGTK